MGCCYDRLAFPAIFFNHSNESGEFYRRHVYNSTDTSTGRCFSPRPGSKQGSSPPPDLVMQLASEHGNSTGNHI